MNQLFDDSSPAVEEKLLELRRHAPPWWRMELQAQFGRTVRDLALCGLRQRFPQASHKDLHRRLADLIQGPELAFLAYGPCREEGESNAL